MCQNHEQICLPNYVQLFFDENYHPRCLLQFQISGNRQSSIWQFKVLHRSDTVMRDSVQQRFQVRFPVLELRNELCNTSEPNLNDCHYTRMLGRHDPSILAIFHCLIGCRSTADNGMTENFRVCIILRVLSFLLHL